MKLPYPFSLLPLALAASAPGGGGRLIAVAALGLDESAEISVHAAHAPNFLLFGDDGKLREVVANPFLEDHQDTAPKVVDLLEKKGVRMLIAGNLGERMAALLDERGIGHITDMGLANIAAYAHRMD
jgi:predicted Fe-Mo cluster-binding NifX family protein